MLVFLGFAFGTNKLRESFTNNNNTLGILVSPALPRALNIPSIFPHRTQEIYKTLVNDQVHLQNRNNNKK